MFPKGECGASPEEAASLECYFDPMLSAWLSPEYLTEHPFSSLRLHLEKPHSSDNIWEAIEYNEYRGLHRSFDEVG